MAKPLRKKDCPLFDDIAEHAEGTRTAGNGTFRAGQPTPRHSRILPHRRQPHANQSSDPQLLDVREAPLVPISTICIYSTTCIIQNAARRYILRRRK